MSLQCAIATALIIKSRLLTQSTNDKTSIEQKSIRTCVLVCFKKRKGRQRIKHLFQLPVLLFNALPVHARLSGTLVGPRQTQKTVSAGWTQAVEPVHLINTGSSTLTRV